MVRWIVTHRSVVVGCHVHRDMYQWSMVRCVHLLSVVALRSMQCRLERISNTPSLITAVSVTTVTMLSSHCYSTKFYILHWMMSSGIFLHSSTALLVMLLLLLLMMMKIIWQLKQCHKMFLQIHNTRFQHPVIVLQHLAICHHASAVTHITWTWHSATSSLIQKVFTVHHLHQQSGKEPQSWTAAHWLMLDTLLEQWMNLKQWSANVTMTKMPLILLLMMMLSANRQTFTVVVKQCCHQALEEAVDVCSVKAAISVWHHWLMTSVSYLYLDQASQQQLHLSSFVFFLF